MTVFEWLNTQAGTDLQHALILLIVALAGYLQFLTHRTTKKNERILSNHSDWHARHTAAAQRMVDDDDVFDK